MTSGFSQHQHEATFQMPSAYQKIIELYRSPIALPLTGALSLLMISPKALAFHDLVYNCTIVPSLFLGGKLVITLGLL
jgi:hypothetical protein